LVSPTFVSAAFSSRACNVELRRAFSSPSHDQIELALAHQSAFLEFGVVRREQDLSDLVLVLCRDGTDRVICLARSFQTSTEPSRNRDAW